MQAVADVTGFPEMLDGRVRTLHPAIHAGILARRDNPEHMRQLAESRYDPIDMVVVSLYPFAETVARGADDDSIVENIDIGGPTMIRAAAKNRDSVAVVVSPAQYEAVLVRAARARSVSRATRHRLATEAFAHVAAYDTQVAAWLRSGAAGETLPAELTVGGPRLARAPLRREPAPARSSLRSSRTAGRDGSRTPAAGCGTVLHELARRRRRTGAGRGIRRACRLRDQAHQPVRLRGRRDAGGRVQAGVRLRSTLRVRRHRRCQPTNRPRDRDRADRDVPRSRGVPGRGGRRCSPSRHQAANPRADRGSAVRQPSRWTSAASTAACSSRRATG